ncbi:hypothetical protein [Stenotrophomonas rhizophila]|uniref:hypothetical protein n=1 Tax=Stenotrophomonas rhizophila TaxID=216778 RepID=UPI001E3B730E|nr:hypothetical protein [Stenotrophomonas rhizophila]MCC7633267.1 hypothetical protein [Stenotrophomonas rhizophila]MCC7662159.1 hypothetical protein [Stenotrophomonas rhizophila]
MRKFVVIAIRSRAETTNLAQGRALISALAAEGMAPQQVSHSSDRFAESFDGEASIAAHWAEMATISARGRTYQSPRRFAWRRRTVVKSSGYVRHGIVNDAGTQVPAAIVITAPWNKSVAWERLFRSILTLFPAQLAMLHLFTAPESVKSAAWASFEAGSLGASLSPQLPNLAWATYFGDEFAIEGNREELRDAGYRVDDFANGYMVKVTDDLQDLETNFAGFSLRRAKLKAMYRKGLFRIEEEPALDGSM